MRFIRWLLSLVTAVVRNSSWREDVSRIGTGLVIAGVATPVLSSRGDLLSGIIIAIIGLVLIILSRVKEASSWKA